MNWDAAGAIGEIVGAVAVLVTLGYLAMQVRQSSAATRAQIRQSLADSQINYLNSRATDPFLRDVGQKMMTGQPIEESELFGLRVHLVAHIRLLENYFAQYQIGTMDPEDWRAMRAVIKNVFRLAPYRDTYDRLPDGWNAEFAREVQDVLAELDREAG